MIVDGHRDTVPTLHPAHSTLHTAHGTRRTAHGTLHPVTCTLHLAPRTLHTAHSAPTPQTLISAPCTGGVDAVDGGARGAVARALPGGRHPRGDRPRPRPGCAPPMSEM